MISTLKRDKAKLTHKIQSTRTYILVLKHMLASCESKRDELTKEFNSKNVSYRNKCSKAKSKKLSLENKIQRIKEIELKRHHLEDTMKTRQSKRDDRLAKTRAGLRRLERAKEEKSSDEVSSVERNNTSVVQSTVETKWQELIKPYNNDVMAFLSMFESKKQELASREQRLKELQESSNYESSNDTGNKIMSPPSAENDDGSDDDDKKESDTENVEEEEQEVETEENNKTIQQLLSDSLSIN